MDLAISSLIIIICGNACLSLCVGLAADWRPVWGPCEPELNQLILFLLLLNILEMDAGDDTSSTMSKS